MHAHFLCPMPMRRWCTSGAPWTLRLKPQRCRPSWKACVAARPFITPPWAPMMTGEDFHFRAQMRTDGRAQQA
eukprot:scaffold204390_cov24-Tisochrysis_lutea.AAC.2